MPEHQKTLLAKAMLPLRCRWRTSHFILIFHIHRNSVSSFGNFERKVAKAVFKLKNLQCYINILGEFRRLNFHKNNSPCFLLLVCVTFSVALDLNISF